MSETRQRYAIRIADVLAPRWVSYFGLTAPDISSIQRSEGTQATQIVLTVMDQTELVGVINLFNDFGMKIESITCLEPADAGVAFLADQDPPGAQQR